VAAPGGGQTTFAGAPARSYDQVESAMAASAAFEKAPCALCGSEAYTVVYGGCGDRLLGVPGRFDVVRCTRCGLARTTPRPTRDSIGAYYPSTYAHFRPDETERGPVYRALRYAVRVPYRLRYGRVQMEEPPAGDRNRLLDVGSGAGLFLVEMAGLGWEPWAIEPNAELARRTIERLRLPEDRVFAGSAEDADLPEAAFDLVTMSHVLEHLHDPAAVLVKVHHALRPGGRLRILGPNYGSHERRVFGRHWHGLDVPRHLHHFSPTTLRLLLERTGFRVERVVPQWQANMLTGSVVYAFDAARGRRGPYREPRGLHYLLLPVASALLALGEGGCMDVVATSRGRDDRAASS
jgi:SAM-dependent methyltransferase